MIVSVIGDTDRKCEAIIPQGVRHFFHAAHLMPDVAVSKSFLGGSAHSVFDRVVLCGHFLDIGVGGIQNLFPLDEDPVHLYQCFVVFLGSELSHDGHFLS